MDDYLGISIVFLFVLIFVYIYIDIDIAQCTPTPAMDDHLSSSGAFSFWEITVMKNQSYMIK